MIPVLTTHCWRPPNSNLTLGLLPIFGAHQTQQPHFLWAQTQILLWGEFVLLGSLPNSNFTPGAFAHLGGPLGPFGVQGPKIKFYSFGICPFGVNLCILLVISTSLIMHGTNIKLAFITHYVTCFDLSTMLPIFRLVYYEVL
jgi:hypothetical protein